MAADSRWRQWFAIIWVGQVFSQMGSAMTAFGLGIWAWEQTGQAAPLALVLLFDRAARIAASVFAGNIVDRFDRKRLLFISDGVAGLSTFGLLLLFVAGNLQLWHIYVVAALLGFFSYIQLLTYSVSLTTLVPVEHHSRSVGWVAVAGRLAAILAPAIAAVLYERFSLGVIMAADLATFFVALGTLRLFPAEKIGHTPDKAQSGSLLYGVRHIFERSGLRAIVSFLMAFNFFNTAAFALIAPLVLAKTNDSETTLGLVQSMMGVGGILGALTLGLWGGPQRKMNVLLVSLVVIGVTRMAFGVSDVVLLWVIAGVISGFFGPFTGNANQSIWMRKVEPDQQGRVFAARYLLAQAPAALALLIVGPLADNVFVPLMQSRAAFVQSLQPVFGSGTSGGFALLFSLLTVGATALTIAGFAWRPLYAVETLEPDSDHIQATETEDIAPDHSAHPTRTSLKSEGTTMTSTTDSNTAKAYCNVLALEKGLDPAGYAGVFDSAFALELPLPWPRAILLTPERLPPELIQIAQMVFNMPEEERPSIRPLFIAPDEAYSKPGYRRLLYYTRPPGSFAAYDCVEYLVPEEEVGALIWATFHQSDDLSTYNDYLITQTDTRDIMVCTHGTVDVACAKFGYPLYRHLRDTFDGSEVRVWRVNHFGGHVFAPTLIDFPKGDYWAFVDPDDGEKIVRRTGSIATLRSKYRGWAGMSYGFAQALEREILMQEGWNWQGYHKRCIDLAKEEGEHPTWAKIRIEYEAPNGSLAGAYEGTVTIGHRVETHPSTDEGKIHAYAQYTVSELKKL